VHGLGPSLRQFVRFTRPWERVVLGLVLLVVGAVTNFYFLSAVGVVLAGVTILGVRRRRRDGVAGANPSAVSEKDPGSEVREP
jgi:hypothetical protein